MFHTRIPDARLPVELCRRRLSAAKLYGHNMFAAIFTLKPVLRLSQNSVKDFLVLWSMVKRRLFGLVPYEPSILFRENLSRSEWYISSIASQTSADRLISRPAH